MSRFGACHGFLVALEPWLALKRNAVQHILSTNTSTQREQVCRRTHSLARRACIVRTLSRSKCFTALAKTAHCLVSHLLGSRTVLPVPKFPPPG